ncbi:MAG: ABC transporter permease [Thermoanaerobaculia bacterium]|nr:ABC transporter permease [Thermoanaerobaculia bacterium]MCZ7652385.1 ABC transporter permease [Thermoanaerobaculia bacterium]
MLSTARELVTHRGLLAALTARDLKARYRGSALGFLWSLANPLLLLAVYTFVFGVVFQQRALTQPYPLFLLCGLFPWVWFASALNEGTVALAANSGLLRRAVFPVELLPTVPVLANLLHFLFALPVLAVALAVGRLLGHPVGGWSALALPLVIALQLPMTGGLALGLAALHVHFKDVKDLLANLLALLFFLTPILYPLQLIEIPALAYVVRVSPMTPFVLGYQELLFAGRLPGPGLWAQMAAAAAIAWVAGAGLFARLRETLVEAA